MNKYSCVVWDWNGTLLDDVDANLRTANRMLSKRSLTEITSKEEYRRLFCFPVVNFYKKVNFDLTSEDFVALAEEYVVTYTEENTSSELFCGAREVLDKLNSSGIRQVVVSATEHIRLGAEVASHGVDKCFSDILGVGDNFGSSKVAVAEKFVAGSGHSPHEILFIGDTDHDSAVAAACGCDCILVSRGHISAESLEKTGFPVVDDITKVLEYIL